MIMQLLTQRKLDKLLVLLCAVLAMQTVMLCVGMYACGKRVSVGSINFNQPPRVLTVDQASAMWPYRQCNGWNFWT